jgi:hypothetical protein
MTVISRLWDGPGYIMAIFEGGKVSLERCNVG